MTLGTAMGAGPGKQKKVGGWSVLLENRFKRKIRKIIKVNKHKVLCPIKKTSNRYLKLLSIVLTQ